MIFRRPNSYSITLKRAHSLLRIPRNTTISATSGGEGLLLNKANNIPSRDQIQEAFRAAAKRYHPDTTAAGANAAAISSTAITSNNINKTAKKLHANKIFRECNDARELLLDCYVRRKFIPKEIVESTKDHPPVVDDETSLFSVWNLWKTNRSFQLEVFLRYSICLGLALGTYYHDVNAPERRKRQIRQRDVQYYQFGPQTPRF
ncbi:hypothetical protein ACHAXR_006981 [Thalassiosira sp. AJA248-18]